MSSLCESKSPTLPVFYHLPYETDTVDVNGIVFANLSATPYEFIAIRIHRGNDDRDGASAAEVICNDSDVKRTSCTMPYQMHRTRCISASAAAFDSQPV
ncbi:MAG: hypothetical protein AB8B64_16550 [Granulosicoccus sp.]